MARSASGNQTATPGGGCSGERDGTLGERRRRSASVACARRASASTTNLADTLGERGWWLGERRAIANSNRCEKLDSGAISTRDGSIERA